MRCLFSYALGALVLGGLVRPVHAQQATSPAPATSPAARHSLYQYSVLDAFLSGVFDGDCTVGQLRQRGDFGIGSYNGADGELVALDGIFYQVRSDGVVRVMPDSARSPFAVVHRFTPSRVLYRTGPLTKDGMEKWLAGALPSPNGIYGIRITGRFRAVKTRAIPPTNQRPYPTLAALIPTQKTFDFHDARGTFIGYRLPPYLKALNVPGFHFHFLTEDRKAGGHVLDYIIEEVRVDVDEIQNLVVQLPGSQDAAFAAAPLDRDRSGETKRVETDPLGTPLSRPASPPRRP